MIKYIYFLLKFNSTRVTFQSAHSTTAIIIVNYNKWNLRLSKDEIAEFLIKNEQKKCKNMQNMLLKECYLLFD